MLTAAYAIYGVPFVDKSEGESVSVLFVQGQGVYLYRLAFGNRRLAPLNLFPARLLAKCVLYQKEMGTINIGCVAHGISVQSSYELIH